MHDKRSLSSGGLGAELAGQYVPEAVDLVAMIMRKPPRNAQVMLKAAQLLLDLAGELPKAQDAGPGASAIALRTPAEIAELTEMLRAKRKAG